jgi:hypothetical protein
VLPPYVMFYQRFLAKDPEEAVDILQRYLADHPLERVYDELFLSALRSAKNDRDHGLISAADHSFLLEEMGRVLREVVLPRQHADWMSREEKAEPSVESRPVVVLGIASRPGSDELALEAFKHSLNPAKCRFKACSAKLLGNELLERIAIEEPACVLVSAFSARGLIRVRYLVKIILGRFPDCKIVVGCWACDKRRIREKLTRAGVAQVCVSFQECREWLTPLLQISPTKTQPAEPLWQVR